jgi:hypothetical protein
VGKPEGKRPLGKSRSRLIDNVKMDLLGTGWDRVDWIGPAQDRNKWESSRECGKEPSSLTKC